MKNKMRSTTLLTALLACWTLSACQSPSGTAAGESDGNQRPNIVLIMADDLGFSDLGCYGGEIQTPHLDSLAENGLRFSRFYNTSRCCPTRAALLTGLYNHQAGIGNMTTDQQQEGYRGHLLENAVTLAEVLKAAGYRTGMAGKWHVSNTLVQETPEKQLAWLNHQEFHPEFSPLEQYPVNRGFEKYFGNIWGVVDFFDPFSLVNGTEAVKEVPAGYYHTDAINDTASAYIREFAAGDAPFFLYVAHTAPHWPLHALPEDIEKYKDTYTAGWEAIRGARYKRLIENGILDEATHPLPPLQEETGTSWEDNPHQAWDARAMAVHAAMIDRMDQGIGRIIQTLKETGELENTLILFLSDNGASPENSMRYGPGFDRPGATRSGEKIRYPVDKEALPGPQTTFASIGPQWAQVSNTPFRYWKMESFEGGTRTPLIAFWPKGIRAKKGSVTHQVGHVMDFMATFVDLAQAHYPETHRGHRVKPMQGKSLKPIFEDRQREGHEALFNEHHGGRSVRTAEWKLVTPDAKSPWELYRIDQDGTETRDMARQHPGVVQQLDSLWHDWARTNQVLPKP